MCNVTMCLYICIFFLFPSFSSSFCNYMLEVFQYYMYNYMYMNDMQIELKPCYKYIQRAKAVLRPSGAKADC